MLGRSRQIRYVKKKKNHISIEVRDLKKFPLTPPTYNKLKNIKTYIQHTKKQQRRKGRGKLLARQPLRMPPGGWPNYKWKKGFFGLT